MTHFLLRASAINISKLIAKPSHEQIIQAEVSGQLSESWAHLSSYSAEHKKHTHTHSCLFISLLFLNPPPLRRVMNGRYEFSAASPGFSLRPSAAEQTTRSQLKGAIKNLLEPCTFWVYLCMVLKHLRDNMENTLLCSCCKSKPGSFLLFLHFESVNKPFMSSDYAVGRSFINT